MFSYLPQQQRLAQMEALYPQFAQQVPIRASIVMNKEEANAQQVAYDGSISLFLNNAKNEIYAKKLGTNGLPEFYTYVLLNEPKKKDDLDDIKNEIAFIKKIMEDLKNVKQSDDASVSVDKPTKKQSKSDECD